MEIIHEVSDWLYRWQTLATGVLAVAAAVFAGLPVWRQLRSSQAQTYAIMRDQFEKRLEQISDRQLKSREVHLDLLNKLHRSTDDWEWRENPTLHPEQAFELASRSRAARNSFERFSIEIRDVAPIELAKSDVIIKLTELENILDQIHLPISSDQTGEDYAISDKRWAEMKIESQQAHSLVGKAIENYSSAIASLASLYSREAEQLKNTLRKLDDKLAESV